MRKQGYVRISRSVLDLAIWQDPYDGQLFFHCLMKASYRTYGFLKPGQLIYSVQGMARQLNWTRNCVARHIQKLSALGLIRVEPAWSCSVMTICVWDELCGEGLGSNGQAGMETDDVRTGMDDCRMNPDVLDTDAFQKGMDDRRKRMDAPEKSTNALERSRACAPKEHIQKEKKDNKEKHANYARESEFFRWWKLYPRHEGQKAAMRAWMEMNDVPAETLTRALENARNSEEWRKENGRFIPSAVKWLDGKWEDYAEQPESEVNIAWTEY